MLQNLFVNTQQTIVTAHRGYSGAFPENTLLAFEEAIKIGCHFIEFDLRGTNDDVPMVMHDQTVDRTCDGSGAISELSFEEVKQLNASYWQGSHNEGLRLHTPTHETMSVPSFEEVLQLVKGRICLNIQVYDARDVVLKNICDLYKSYDLYNEAYLSMSTFAEADMVRSIDKNIELCVLERQSQMDAQALREQKDYGCTYIQPTRADASEELCAYASALGLRASMFYSNTEADNRRYQAMGMPGLLSDFPNLLLS